MTLSLDHAQRLNLIVLLGLLECNVGETRAVWKLQDHLALTGEEKQTIGYFVQSNNGNQIHGWDLNKTLPAQHYDLADSDVTRIQLAIRQFPRHRVSLARPWLEPLLAQLPAAAENGAGPTQ